MLHEAYNRVRSSFSTGCDVFAYVSLSVCHTLVRSFVRSLRAGVPAYSEPQRRDLYIGPLRQPRERRGIGRCVRCMCALCMVDEGTVGVSSLSGISKCASSRLGLLSG